MRQRRGDLVLVQVGGARFDVVAVRLQPLVVAGSDPIAEHVHGLGLALEPGGQLLGDERVGQVLERPCAVDRVVVGDRHEIHPTTLGEVVYLVWVGRAFGNLQGSLDPQPRQLRGGAVHVHVGPALVVHDWKPAVCVDVTCEEAAAVP
jgi:hypothetical protein